ncbi:MAG: PKD domain-containing protein [Planctomycetota bacterium]|nr:MAG: PKD domain-containing protein [Planctomycetota bacterium]
MRQTRWLCSGLGIVAAILSTGGCNLGGLNLPGLPSTGQPIAGSAFNLPPTPVITASITRGVAPLTVQFNSDRSSDDGLIVSRVWDFGDGTTSQLISPRHTFTGTGTFTVRLTLTDDQGATASATVDIVVTEAPVARIAVDRTSAESAPAVFNFDASGSFDPDGEIVQYQWDFGDGSRELLPVVAHTYPVPGTFRVVLTVTDDTGVTSTAETLISVGIPVPSVTLRIPPPSVKNIVVAAGSQLWVQAEFDVDPSAARFTRAGLDRDRDTCDARSVVYDSSGQQQGIIRGHDGPVRAAVLTPDGQTLLSGSDDGTVRAFDVASGTQKYSVSLGSTVQALALTPDGTQFAAGLASGAVSLRNVSDGSLIRTLSGHTAGVNDLAFSSDASRLVSGSSDRKAIVWDVAAGSQLRSFDHDQAVRAVALSPIDANLLATGDDAGVIRLWNMADGSLIRTIDAHDEAVNDLLFSPDGATLYSASDDNTARSWNPNSGAAGTSFEGHVADVVALAISPDGATLYTGSDDATLRSWNAADGSALQTLQPCVSPVAAVAVSADGQTIVAGVAAANDIPLDTKPPSGNDVVLTVPRALSLADVPSLGGEDVPPGQYFLWVEVDTDRTDPVRAYAEATVQVVSGFTDTISSDTPQIPLVNDQATVLVAPNVDRQVFDLGPMNAGDRIFLSLSDLPGYGEVFDPGGGFSLMLLEESPSNPGQYDIFAWYQSGFILFTRDTRLVVPRDMDHLYAVVDGGVSVNVRIARESEIVDTRPQRVLLDFVGGRGISVAGLDPMDIPELDAADFNDFFTVNPNFGASDTVTLKQTIRNTVESIYADFQVDVFTTDDTTQPQPPFLRMYVGGTAPLGTTGLLGISDYIDPRNETATGAGITFAISVGQLTIENSNLANPVTNLNDLGVAIGRVAAHEIGHLLGLRHTQESGDLMQNEGPEDGDPTILRTLKRGLVSNGEQLFGLAPLGYQDAPKLLEETVGRR